MLKSAVVSLTTSVTSPAQLEFINSCFGIHYFTKHDYKYISMTLIQHFIALNDNVVQQI